jgi:Putative auto-transporter adhesin, head GIN domain
VKTKNEMKKLITYLLLSSSFLVSCQKILFNEDERTRELSFEDFHAVKIKGIYNIVLTQDSTDRLVIIGRNNISSIDAVIRDDTLIIDDHRRMSLNPGMNTLVLHFSNLEYMVTYDPVNVSNTDTIKADRFSYDAIGEIAEVRLVVDCNSIIVFNSANTLGYLYFYGNANYCTFCNRYGSCIFADNLSCRYAEIINESAGDVYINASDNIEAYIWGPGNIYYYGAPVIEIAEKRGDGRVIPIN